MFSMLQKIICLISFVLVLSVVGDVQAAVVVWDYASGDHLWSTPINWNNGQLPTSDDEVRIKMLPGPTITNEGAATDKLWVGQGGSTGALTVDGGTLTVTRDIILSNGDNGEGTFNMNSGIVTAGGVFHVGIKGLGTLNMTGGTIIGKQLRIGWQPTGIGHVNLDGGIITTESFLMRVLEGAVGTMDVRAGTLIRDGNDVSRIQGYIDNGWITAYDGNGTLQLDYDVTNEGKTTLSATHLLNPNPADGAIVAPGEVELSWTLPDPCVPGQPVPVDVYFTDDLEALEMFTDPAAIRVISQQNVTSVAVQTQAKTRYYWAVDTYIGDPRDPILGPIFSFFTDNLPPRVNAGVDIVTWLEDGSRVGNLDATVTDDEAYTVQWTVVSEPNEGNVVIETATVEDTRITLLALGEYVLQLEASDGEYAASDTVTINVYNDVSEATKSLPDYVPLVGDINGDCKVDEVDMSLLQENLGKDNLITEEWFKLD